ncbi:DUF262 domain-containing protein [Sutcliffiella horikoshii]|uniref:DUF262 domain-containing protein n=1 Tax=Sutcliffiella horikoshii TaxID=79883 RepID=A0A5D4T4C2_9BACI|nr:DUF262 domain-containing protein [Sutcliffiella horikoshii]TYS69751.1 DUF262 domain-containing protein [Sutcliffiella horikoshii]
MSKINFSVKSISDVLQIESLKIPEYQRPYKWERRHIRNLFYDIREAIDRNISEYRIGSIILHNKDNENIDVVDGQQRLISISLFMYCVGEDNLPDGASNLLNGSYVGISRLHAKENYDEWRFLCGLISKEEVDVISNFMMNHCKVSVIEMPSECLSEAFQLFDSQNNRGKALEPHDLLKAYHLRAIKDESEQTVENWEKYVDDKELKLSDLFDKHLFRIRRWINGDTGLYRKRYGSELRFTERFIGDFKGVNLQNASYPYLQLYKELLENDIALPNSICMPIINGNAFFQFIEFSYEHFKNNFHENSIVEGFLSDEIKEIVNSKKSKYARNINLFTNLLATFIDRFGADQLDRETCEKVFVWAFYPRTAAKAIYNTTLANYAASGTFQKKKCQKLFQELAVSATPREFVARIDTDMLGNLTAADIINKLQEEVKR